MPMFLTGAPVFSERATNFVSRDPLRRHRPARGEVDRDDQVALHMPRSSSAIGTRGAFDELPRLPSRLTHRVDVPDTALLVAT